MRNHFPEYLSEFLGTGIMMIVGVGAIAVFWAGGSPLPTAIPDARLRLLLTGIVFAAGATLVVYSPLGQRSGGHLNPAVTLAFWTLRKIPGRDAVSYMISQTLGATTGVAVVALAGGKLARNVRDGLTLPGPGYAPWMAFLAEVGITFLLVLLILIFVDTPRIAPFTGLAAGALVALLVAIEAPVSGTSLNPARSLGPAIVAAIFKDLWIYLSAPLLGASAAAGLFRSRWFARRAPFCAKLYHTEKYRCIFADCGYQLVRAGGIVVRAGEPANHAYIVLRGQVELWLPDPQGHEVVLGRAGPSEWVGEMGLLLSQPHSTTVVALTDVQLRPITRENFARIIREHPEKALELLRQLARRLKEADHRMAR